MTEYEPYSEAGKVTDEFARRKNVRGPYNIEKFVQERTGDGPTGSHWSQILYGKNDASVKVMRRFARAMDLNEEEKVRLAIAYFFESEE